MVKFTERDIAIVAALAGTADFLTEGRFSAPVARALKRAAGRAAPAAARTIPRLAGTAARVGKTVALRHPVLTAGAVVYYTYQNREELGDLVEQGYEVIQPAVTAVRERVDPILERAAEITTTAYPTGPGIIMSRPRKPSSFNKAVSKGMKAVKGSTSYGKKGIITNAKKAFSMVTKVASAKKKKRKAPKSGIRRKVWNAMGRLI